MSDTAAILRVSEPLIDAAWVEQLRRDPVEWTEIVELYRTYAAQLVAAIEAAAAGADRRAVAHPVHQLKGCSANLGLLAVVAVCEQLEDAARRGALETVGDPAPVLRRLIELSLARLK